MASLRDGGRAAHQWYLAGNGMLATGNWGVALTWTWAVRELSKVLIASNRKRILKDAYDRVSSTMVVQAPSASRGVPWPCGYS